MKLPRRIPRGLGAKLFISHFLVALVGALTLATSQPRSTRGPWRSSAGGWPEEPTKRIPAGNPGSQKTEGTVSGIGEAMLSTILTRNEERQF